MVSRYYVIYRDDREIRSDPEFGLPGSYLLSEPFRSLKAARAAARAHSAFEPKVLKEVPHGR